MPGPTTEVLSDDLKEIRTDLHKIEVNLTAEIHKSQTALTAEIHQGDNALATEIHKADKAISKLGAEFAVFKWFLGATLATTVSGVVGSAYWAGTLSSRVSSLETRVDKIDSRLDRIDGRLERIEASIIKAIGRGEGSGR